LSSCSENSHRLYTKSEPNTSPAFFCKTTVACTLSVHSRYLQIFFARNIITDTKCSEKITVLLFQPNPTHGYTQPVSISVAATETHPVSSSYLYLCRDNISRLDSFFVYRATLLCILARPSARFAIQFVKQRPPLSRIAPLPCVYLPHYLTRGSLGRS